MLGIIREATQSTAINNIWLQDGSLMYMDGGIPLEVETAKAYLLDILEQSDNKITVAGLVDFLTYSGLRYTTGDVIGISAYNRAGINILSGGDINFTKSNYQPASISNPAGFNVDNSVLLSTALSLFQQIDIGAIIDLTESLKLFLQERIVTFNSIIGILDTKYRNVSAEDPINVRDQFNLEDYHDVQSTDVFEITIRYTDINNLNKSETIYFTPSELVTEGKLFNISIRSGLGIVYPKSEGTIREFYIYRNVLHKPAT